jgi:hypothetical protein
MTIATKRIEDLPHFRVTSVKPSETCATDFQLVGVFDRITTVREGECSLLVPGKTSLIALSGDLKFQDTASTALFQTSDKSMPDLVGLDLVYVDPNWEPYHVWMVAEPRWKWNRTLFHATDVIARTVDGNGASTVDGEEVTKWIEIKQNIPSSRLSRFYPIFPSGKSTLPPVELDGIIKGGWNHAHCELCETRIEPENYGYLDLGGHWVCEGCYSKYVGPHDLSFIQE